MAKNKKSSNLITTVNEIATIARNREIAHLVAEDKKLDGRTISLKGKHRVHFGSCSYLGLELDSRIIEAGIEALRNYGSQFSCSRTYVSIPLYEELEELLKKMFGKPVIISTCSTLGHQAVIPIIVEEEDAVILDQQAHISMQDAANKLQLRGTTVTVLRHNRLDDLQKKIEELSSTHRNIWYFIDGVYSMYGDFAPIHDLIKMLNTHKQLHLYVDDAHGMSWTGEHGSGYIRSQVELHPRMVLATSLAKGFASAGGVFVLPNEEMYWKIKNWGGPLTYSGPQQPSVLGASIASAKIHLSDEIAELQKTLQVKINLCNEIMKAKKLPVVAQSEAPIFFVGLGLTKVGYNMVRRLSDDGYYVNLGIFPAVPETCTGLRFTITNHHKTEDIEGLAERICYHLPNALKEEGRSMNDVYRAFKSLSQLREQETMKQLPESIHVVNLKPNFKLQHETTIKSIPEDDWNQLLGANGSFDWKGLLLLEESFKDNVLPEDNWEFHYYLIKDQTDRIILATFFTLLLIKDDMLAPEAVSRKIEQLRINDPYYLTSKTFMMGSLLSDGDHLYVDKSHSGWKDAMMLLLDEVWTEQEKQNAGMLYLRDFLAEDIEMRNFLIDQGFIKVDIPDAHIIDNSKHYSRNEFLSGLSYKKRYHIRQDVLKFESDFDVSIATDPSSEEIEYWYSLYENVKKKNLEVNTFVLPKKFFYNVARSAHWDVLVLRLKSKSDTKENSLPVAVGLAYKNQNYSPVILGIDYSYLLKNKVYKQMLFQFIPRALELNSNKIYLGLTTSLEKRKLGAVAVPKIAFIQVKDHYNLSLIGLIPNTKIGAIA